MFCSKCGCRIDDSAQFCSGCGTQTQAPPEGSGGTIVLEAVQKEEYTPPIAAVPAKTGSAARVLAILVASLVSLALVCGAGYVAYDKVFAEKDNAITAMFKASQAFEKISEFDIKASFSVEGQRVEAEGGIKLGADLQNSSGALNLKIGENGTQTANFGFTEGRAGGKATSYGYDEYFYIDDICFDLSNQIFLSSGTWFDFNSIVKDGCINTNFFTDMMYSNFDTVMDNPLLQLNAVQDLADGMRLIGENFVNECKKDSVSKRFLLNEKKSKSGDITTYTFTIDIFEYFNAYKDYVSTLDNSKDRRIQDASVILSTMFNQMDIDEIKATLPDMRFDLTISVDGQNRYRSIGFTIDPTSLGAPVGTEKIDISLEFANYNSSSISPSDIKLLLDNAQRNSYYY